uniref:TruB pseudouridine (psi) synthase family member 2 n=1 Tax=Oryzias latipes TaxID=8090 RepID=H2N0D8_ORYLA
MAMTAVKDFHKLRRLHGLFCVYKPLGVHWKLVRDTIETNLLKGNVAPPPALPHKVRFLAEPSPTGEAGAAASLSAAPVPALSHHPLVTGPEFQHIRVGVGHRLDAASSGVLVLAVGNGNKALDDLYKTRVTRDYMLECEFGMATKDFSHTGRVVEKSTYGHITLDKLERVLAMLEGANQKATRMFSNVDMSSQEAYELAVQGLLGPDGKSAPILTGLRCVHFQPPSFTLEVQCLNETQKYLRKVVHEIGLELRSTAVCKNVRRTRDGLFTSRQALTRNQWSAADVMQAVQQHRYTKKTEKTVRKRSEESSAATRQSKADVMSSHRGKEHGS